MDAKVRLPRLLADTAPDGGKPIPVSRSVRASDRKRPRAGAGYALEDMAGGLGKARRPRTSLAAAQEQVSSAVVRPAKSQDFALSAPGQHEQPYGRDLERPPGLATQ